MISKLIDKILALLKPLDIAILLIASGVCWLIHNVPFELFGWYPNAGEWEIILRCFPVIIVAAIWLIYRYAIPFIRQKSPKKGWIPITWGVVGIVFISWVMAFYQTGIRTPVFKPDKIGIFVAQLEGEKGNEKQKEMVYELNQQIASLMEQEGGVFEYSEASMLYQVAF